MNAAQKFPQFASDLAIAEETETDISQLLAKRYNMEVVKRCHDSRYDILMRKQSDGKLFSFEVKEDFTHARTGNIGLEFECRGKPSGISVSKSDYYIYKLHNRNKTVSVYLIRTDTLKWMVQEKKYFRIVNGGDEGSNSMCYLFRHDVFTAEAKRIA